MTSFENYIQSVGFVPYKREWDKTQREWIETKLDTANQLSTVTSGGLSTVWKDGSFVIEIGLNEHNGGVSVIIPRSSKTISDFDSKQVESSMSHKQFLDYLRDDCI